MDRVSVHGSRFTAEAVQAPRGAGATLRGHLGALGRALAAGGPHMPPEPLVVTVLVASDPPRLPFLLFNFLN